MPETEQEEPIVTVALDPKAWMRVTVLVSFALAVILILMFLISGGGEELFQRKVTLRTYFADGTGLQKKGVVEVDGIPVGRIASVELSHSNEPSRVVKVEMSVERRYLASIPVDSRAEVTADNLLGDKYVNIRKGIAGESAKPGDELLAQPPSNNFNPADLIASLESILKQTSAILDTIDDPKSELGQLVQGEALYDEIRDDIASIQRTVHAYGNPRSPAGQAVFGSELYNQLRAPINDIDKQLAAIQNGEGPIGHAYASTEQYDGIRDQIVDFHKSVADLKGNKFLTTNEFYANVSETLKDLNTLVASMSNAPLLANAQLYESLNGSSANMAHFLQDFRKNPQKYLRIKVF